MESSPASHIAACSGSRSWERRPPNMGCFSENAIPHSGVGRGFVEASGIEDHWLSHDAFAEPLIVNQRGNGWLLSADRAVQITPDADLTEAHGQRIIHQQAS